MVTPPSRDGPEASAHAATNDGEENKRHKTIANPRAWITSKGAETISTTTSRQPSTRMTSAEEGRAMRDDTPLTAALPAASACSKNTTTTTSRAAPRTPSPRKGGFARKQPLVQIDAPLSEASSANKTKTQSHAPFHRNVSPEHPDEDHHDDHAVANAEAQKGESNDNHSNNNDDDKTKDSLASAPDEGHDCDDLKARLARSEQFLAQCQELEKANTETMLLEEQSKVSNIGEKSGLDQDDELDLYGRLLPVELARDKKREEDPLFDTDEELEAVERVEDRSNKKNNKREEICLDTDDDLEVDDEGSSEKKQGRNDDSDEQSQESCSDGDRKPAAIPNWKKKRGAAMTCGDTDDSSDESDWNVLDKHSSDVDDSDADYEKPVKKRETANLEREDRDDGSLIDPLRMPGAEMDLVAQSEAPINTKETGPLKKRGRPRKNNEAPKRGRPWVKTSPASSKSKAKGSKKREPGTEIGARVYAKWATNGWFWATITAIKRKKSSHFDQYSLAFDDGDFLEYASRKSFITAEKFMVIFEKEPPPKSTGKRPGTLDGGNRGSKKKGQQQQQVEAQKGGPAFGPRQLYVRRCKECELCKQPDCQACDTCKRNKAAKSENMRQVCLHKMCLKIGEEVKKQQAVGFPSGWTYMFAQDKPPLSNKAMHIPVPGLFMFPPNSLRFFRSAEAAVSFKPSILNENARAVEDFNEHIGIKRSRTSGTPASKNPAPPPSGKSSAGTHASKNPAPPPSGKSSSALVSPLSSSSMTLQQLLYYRCGKCVHCKKDDCGRCAACLSNRDSYTQVCIQKMCCKISVERKAQPMPHSAGFPDGWGFVIDPTMDGFRKERMPKKGVQGLKIMSPSGAQYYSVEGAKRQCTTTLKCVAQEPFYVYIGAVAGSNHGAARASTGPSRSEESVSWTSGANVSDEGLTPPERCGMCENCTKDACGKCENCRLARSGGSKCCFQKMCFEIPVNLKAAPAVGFPRGWRFYFDKDRPTIIKKKFQSVPCLWILSPGNKPFRSAEAAISGVRGIPGGNKVAREFYEHVGLRDAMSAQVSGRAKQVKRPVSGPSPLEARSLSCNRVRGARVYCRWQKDEWFWGHITEKIPESGGGFRYSVEFEDDARCLEDVDGEDIMTEVHYKRTTGKNPPSPPAKRDTQNDRDGDSIEERPRKQRRKDDSLSPEIEFRTDHDLVGKGYLREWTDLMGQNRIVFGRVVEYEKDCRKGKIVKFRVAYSSESTRLINSMSACGLAVLDSETLPASQVLGGCVLYAQRKMLSDGLESDLTRDANLPHYRAWITPDLHHEALIQSTDGTSLPRLVLVVMGFRLEFNVKPSTIKGAGYGVFLMCTYLGEDDNEASFELKAGEEIDLGVYAPFRIEDKKPEPVFFAKNFMHSRKCEEWTFNAGDKRFQMDITDDATGDLHPLAALHIPAYVNECGSNDSPTIWAEHDPEGSVHYLLGHAHKSQGPLVVPADGTEVEVFVNYGDVYEPVRIRKGYSSLSGEDMEKALERIAHDDVEDVLELDEYSADAIGLCVNYFYGLFSREQESVFTRTAINRALICAVVLQRRVDRMFLGEEEVDEGDATAEMSDSDLRKLVRVAGKLVSLLLDIVKDDSLRALQAGHDYDGLLRSVFHKQFSERELLDLAGMMN